jgi:hypothetical protein
MKFTPTLTPKRIPDEERRWPAYMFRGRVRTSTVVLIVAFVAVWWVYTTYRTDIKPPGNTHGTETQLVPVPPGFKPDPNYTWVPRSQVQEPPTSDTPTTTTTPTTTPTTSPSPTTTVTTTTPPPFQLPCIVPFCTPTPTTSAPQQTLPGPGPSPTSAPPAG